MGTTPMTAAEWLAKLRAEGVDVREYQNWKTHGRDSATGKTFGPVNGVVIHHTAGTNSLALCYNGMSTLPGPLCHTHLSKTGVASMLSVRRANHAGTFAQNAHAAVLNESAVHPYPDAAEPVDGNDHYYGIEIENLGTGNDRYPWRQYVAAVKWATAICRHHGWTQDSVIGHKEGTRRKIDPKGPVQGADGVSEFTWTMDRFRADVKTALALPTGVWPSRAPQQEEEDMTPEQDTRLKDVEAGLESLIKTVSTVAAQVAKLHQERRQAPWAYKNTAVDPRDTYGVLTDTAKKVDSLSTGPVDLERLAALVVAKLAEELTD